MYVAHRNVLFLNFIHKYSFMYEALGARQTIRDRHVILI